LDAGSFNQEKLKKLWVENFGAVYDDGVIESLVLRPTVTTWGKGLGIEMNTSKADSLVGSRELSDLISLAENQSLLVKRLPDIVSALQDAELSVSDYTTKYQLTVRDLVHTVLLLLVLDHLNVTTISCSPLPLGEGMVVRQDVHLPNPSPGTTKLLIGMRTSPGPSGNTNEILTSSACAVLRILTMKEDGIQCCVPRVFVPQHIGVGRDQDISVRLILGMNDTDHSPTMTSDLWKMDTLSHLEANLDDMTPESLAFAVEILLKSGAVDAWVVPIVMKKGRPAHALHCLCHASEEITHKLLQVMFRQTTTLGVRIQRNIDRAALRRSFLTIQTPFIENEREGKVDVKIGYLGEEVVSIKAEFDHCRIISLETGIPIKVVSDSVVGQAVSKVPVRTEKGVVE
jgi:uncharacterized protein (DUF111 family)